jgi:hypothetical protein
MRIDLERALVGHGPFYYLELIPPEQVVASNPRHVLTGDFCGDDLPFAGKLVIIA